MVYHKTVLADLLTPVSAYLKVAANAKRAFLLESVEGGEKIGRYSFIGVNPYQCFDGNFAEFRNGFPAVEPADPDLPPFTGGAVGIFCYDLIREFERLPGRQTADLPSVMMDYYSTVLAFDHLLHRIVIMSHDSMGRVEELERRLLEGPLGVALPSPDAASGTTDFKTEDDGARFRESVDEAKEYIRAGDIFQVVLSQRFSASFTGEPFNVYRALRYLNPSPYLFFLKRDEFCVAGSSPEMLLRVQGSGLEYRPIAGTRRRGRTPDEEKALEQELLADEKERAEHVMLVDLGRNDLGRVSEFGTVSVEDFMFLEKYSHVMHLVSALRARLRDGVDRFDALAACFPAGTVSGAPKVRAMEIIDELEPCPRGIYAGAIGYLDFSGNLDTCIAIRTIVMRPGEAVFQAGAGIVADSVPELEDKECRNKARVLSHALELSHQFAGVNRS
ncbi:MAG: anthranilate synthase component I [Acidobacteria bacterium]|nr:MAG: anthranilate synthase component I [Acidobacteriota bacterium]